MRVEEITDIGEFLQIQRVERGMTQREVEELTGISRMAVSSTEKSKNIKSFKFTLKLLDLFGYKLEILKKEVE